MPNLLSSLLPSLFRASPASALPAFSLPTFSLLAFLALFCSCPMACCLAGQEHEYISSPPAPCSIPNEYTQEEAYYTQEEVYSSPCPYSSPYLNNSDPYLNTCPGTCFPGTCFPDTCTGTCCSWGQASFSADFLYWLFSSGPREIATSHMPTSAISTTGLTFLGDYEKRFISTQYKPGVRLGATYAFCDSPWALSALYTDFRSTFSNHFRTHNDNASIIPVQMPEIFSGEFLATPISFTKAHSRFRLTYQTLDFCLQYTPSCTPSSLPSCCAQIWEPYFGVRLLELDQKWKVHYETNPTSSASAFGLSTQWKGKLPAIGVTFGVRGNYRICNGFSVIGRLGASCVQGKVHDHAHYEALSTGANLELYKLHDHFRDVFTGWEGAIGLSYTWECPSIPYCTTAFSIGYEVQSWWSMPIRAHDSLLLPVNSWPSHLNFTLHGLFVRGSVLF